MTISPVIKIILSERATAALLAVGECFQIVGKGSYPTDPNRMVIYCQAVPLSVAQDACRILDGSHRAQRIKPPAVATVTPSASASPANMPDRRPDATGANLDASPAIAGNRPSQHAIALP